MRNPVGKYQWYKHHAWAGLAILSILVVIRSIFIFPNQIFVPAILVLIVYIVVSLIGAYRYSGSILKQVEYENVKTMKDQKKIEKLRLKLEKKRAKAEYKAKKKK